MTWHKGEIFGLCGLSDSGIREVGQRHTLLPVDSGEVSLPTHNVSIGNPYQALQNRVAYVPKDRDGEALMMGASIQNNFCLPSVRDPERALWFPQPKEAVSGILQGAGAIFRLNPPAWIS